MSVFYLESPLCNFTAFLSGLQNKTNIRPNMLEVIRAHMLSGKLKVKVLICRTLTDVE